MSEFGVLGSWFPIAYQIRQKPQTFVQEIIVDWLMTELPAPSPEIAKRAQPLSGWRNIEVYYFIKSYDWTERIFH